MKVNSNIDAFATTLPPEKARKSSVRDQVIINRTTAAKARATGINLTNVSDEELLADLRRRRVSA